MRILILNWRDIKNPSSGGAEILTHEMAKRWVAWGHKVIQISSGFKGAPSQETIDGVQLVRRGRWWNIHFLAFFYYWRNLRNQIDVIVDEAHWFPFFAALLYSRRKTVLLTCEVAKSLFFKIFPYPIALFWRIIEKIYFLIYKGIPTLAISTSTKKDLTSEGFHKKDITVLPMGVSIPENLKVFPKEKNPTIMFLGRLNRQKGIDDALKAFKKIKESIPTVRLWIVGRGRNKKTPRSHSIHFFGFVPELEKFQLLSRAHVLIVPSLHEGWGLVAGEAGVVGTPSVGYNVPGLRDIIKHDKTGLLVKNNPNFLAKAVLNLLQDKKKYRKMCKNAIKEAVGRSWDTTAKIALRVFKSNL